MNENAYPIAEINGKKLPTVVAEDIASMLSLKSLSAAKKQAYVLNLLKPVSENFPGAVLTVKPNSKLAAVMPLQVFVKLLENISYVSRELPSKLEVDLVAFLAKEPDQQSQPKKA